MWPYINVHLQNTIHRRRPCFSFLTAQLDFWGGYNRQSPGDYVGVISSTSPERVLSPADDMYILWDFLNFCFTVNVE